MVNKGSLAPDAPLVIGGEESGVHRFRGGAPLALVFLRHLR
jgi:hypothetical protein